MSHDTLARELYAAKARRFGEPARLFNVRRAYKPGPAYIVR